VTAAPYEIDLIRAGIQTALTALREGRSTGDATLDQVADTLRRRWVRAWAHLRGACPNVPAEAIDLAADHVVDVVASIPAMVIRMVVADAASCAAAGGAS
jgi:hypothetical protein